MCSLCNIVISLRRNNFKKDLDEKNFVDWSQEVTKRV